MSWEPGRERVRGLIDAGEVEQVTPDLAIAHIHTERAVVCAPIVCCFAALAFART